MPDLELRAEPRTILGKRVARLRRDGITPANIFGHNIASQAVQVPTLEMTHLMRRAGATHLIRLSLTGEPAPRMVLVRGITRKPTTDQLLHVDFYQVSMTERTIVEVPLVLTGTSPAVAEGLGLLYQHVSTIALQSLPGDIPNQVELDISSLTDAHSAIHVANLPLPPGVTAMDDPEKVVISITSTSIEPEPSVAEEEVPVAAEQSPQAQA
jgi:large subunit ribosomal protein L25